MRPITWALLGLAVALVDLFFLRGTIAVTLYCVAGALGLVALVCSVRLGLSSPDDEAASVLPR